jgi:hypothetical protein
MICTSDVSAEKFSSSYTVIYKQYFSPKSLKPSIRLYGVTRLKITIRCEWFDVILVRYKEKDAVGLLEFLRWISLLVIVDVSNKHTAFIFNGRVRESGTFETSGITSPFARFNKAKELNFEPQRCRNLKPRHAQSISDPIIWRSAHHRLSPYNHNKRFDIGYRMTFLVTLRLDYAIGI